MFLGMRRGARKKKLMALFVAVACLVLRFGSRCRLSVAVDTGRSKSELTVAGEIDCATLLETSLAGVRWRVARMERAVSDGRVIRGFGYKAGRLVNRTLASFDLAQGGGNLCSRERDALQEDLCGQLLGIFFEQRSTVEQALFIRLRDNLLRNMRRRRGEVPVSQKLRMLHSAMRSYDSQVRDLQPFFAADSERSRAEERLSELQWGIAEQPEAKDMLQQWKMERLRRPVRQSRLSVSLSPGMRLMLRPPGLGNLHFYSLRQVGPPHNSNEVAFGVLNDGDVADIYHKKARPPFAKFQPTLGVEVSLG